MYKNNIREISYMCERGYSMNEGMCVATFTAKPLCKDGSSPDTSGLCPYFESEKGHPYCEGEGNGFIYYKRDNQCVKDITQTATFNCPNGYYFNKNKKIQTCEIIREYNVEDLDYIYRDNINIQNEIFYDRSDYIKKLKNICENIKGGTWGTHTLKCKTIDTQVPNVVSHAIMRYVLPQSTSVALMGSPLLLITHPTATCLVKKYHTTALHFIGTFCKTVCV
eukprot:GHVR01009549.1.p1 GENE.GHVR01009549.1~~GHVR01009549.1.p1  ORF type:complete len:222 (-),score=47.93 GHVR01009549.1:124-789(-)